MGIEQNLRISRKAFVLGLTANTLWATSFLASKITLQTWGPATASFLRFVLASATLLVFGKLFGIRIQILKGKQWFVACAVGATAFGFLYPLQLAGLKTISTGQSAAIMLLAPLFVIVFATTLLIEKLKWQKIVSAALGISGGFLILSEKVDLNFSRGSILTLLASMSLGVSVVLTRKFAKDIRTASLTFWSMSFGLLIISPFTFVEYLDGHFFLSSHSLGVSVASLIYLSVVCSAVAFFIWNKAISDTSAQSLAATMHVKTPLAILLGILILNEPITSAFVFGTALIMTAVWLSEAKFSHQTEMGRADAGPFKAVKNA